MPRGDAFERIDMGVADNDLANNSGSAGDSATPTPTASPLGAQQYAEIQQAQDRSKKLRRAITVANMDAWFSGCFAGLTLLFALLSPWSFVLGVPLALIAFNSFRGARLFRAFDLRAPRILAWNQVLLASVIILYALYSLWDAGRGSSEVVDAIAKDPGLSQALGDMRPMLWELSIAIYGSLIAATVITQGLTGLYYKTREKYLAAYLHDTPPWVLELQKKQAGA
jgi:hypothetical protein